MSLTNSNDNCENDNCEISIATNVQESLQGEKEHLLGQYDDASAIKAIPCEDAQLKEARQEEDYSLYPQAKVAASGTAGCVFGCLIGGVVCAVMGGLGSAYAAKHKGGSCVGDTARAMGEVVILAHEKAVVINQKHNVAKTTQEAANRTFAKAKKLDEQYRICEKGQDAMISTGKVIMDFAARQCLAEPALEGARVTPIVPNNIEASPIGKPRI
jgi:hypothetical protein